MILRVHLEQLLIVFVSTFLLGSENKASDFSAQMKLGKPDLVSAGPLAFAPGGILLVGDSLGGAIFAIETGDRDRSSGPRSITVEGINTKVAALLGTTPEDLRIRDMAVNPASGKAYLSVSFGEGPDATPAILRVDQRGEIEVFSLEKVWFLKTVLKKDRASDGFSLDSIIELTYINGRVFAACRSNDAGSPTMSATSFPFEEGGAGKATEIPQGTGRTFEMRSQLRALAPDAIDNEPCLLAGYTLPPLAEVISDEKSSGEGVKGIRAWEYNDSLRRVIIQTVEVRPYQDIDALKGVRQLDRLDDEHALVLIQAESGVLNLQTITFP